jgi:hypothetical protein
MWDSTIIHALSWFFMKKIKLSKFTLFQVQMWDSSIIHALSLIFLKKYQTFKVHTFPSSDVRNGKYVYGYVCQRSCVKKSWRSATVTYGRHLGITRTQHRLEERYYWPRMTPNIRSYVRRVGSAKLARPHRGSRGGWWKVYGWRGHSRKSASMCWGFPSIGSRKC